MHTQAYEVSEVTSDCDAAEFRPGSDWYQIGTILAQIGTRFVPVAVTDTAVAAISFEAKFKSTGPHRRSLTNPRVRTGSPLQIHGSAQAVPYDLEVQIATEIMRLSLPLSLSPLLMLLLLVSGWYHIRTRLVPDSY